MNVNWRCKTEVISDIIIMPTYTYRDIIKLTNDTKVVILRYNEGIGGSREGWMTKGIIHYQ